MIKTFLLVTLVGSALLGFLLGLLYNTLKGKKDDQIK